MHKVSIEGAVAANLHNCRFAVRDQVLQNSAKAAGIDNLLIFGYVYDTSRKRITFNVIGTVTPSEETPSFAKAVQKFEQQIAQCMKPKNVRSPDLAATR